MLHYCFIDFVIFTFVSKEWVDQFFFDGGM
jgi:hypothetical protein